jgi:hypothetical protein
MGIHTIPVKMLGKIPTYYITDTLQEGSLIASYKLQQLIEREAGLLFDDRPLAPAREVLATFPTGISHRVHTQKLCSFVLGALAAPFFERICHRPAL